MDVEAKQIAERIAGALERIARAVETQAGIRHMAVAAEIPREAFEEAERIGKMIPSLTASPSSDPIPPPIPPRKEDGTLPNLPDFALTPLGTVVIEDGIRYARGEREWYPLPREV